MTCAGYQNYYHLDQSCSGIPDNTFVTMGPSKREKWRCRPCRTKGGRSSTDGAVCALQTDVGSFAVQIEAVNQKLNLVLFLKKSVDTLLQLSAEVDDLLFLQSTVEWLTKTVKGVEVSILFFSGR